MISVYDLKPKFQGLLRPIVNSLASKGVTANQITILAMIISIVAGALIVVFSSFDKVMFIIPLVLFVRMALNAIDGMLAREHKMESPLGAILNELGDVVSDTALYLPFAFLVAVNPYLITVFVALAIISEMTGVISVQIGASRRYDGPMGKSDRALWIGLFSIILGLGYKFPLIYDVFLSALIVLIIVTIINRIKKSLGELA